MTLRIISGKFKNRKIKAPKDIRPATATLRGAIFNICKNSIEDSNFLDVFAGSGAMGIEALSRGAKFSTFIDASKVSIRFIKQNIKDLDLEDDSKVILSDAFRALKKMKSSFDIITIDPPFIIFKQNPEYINDLLKIIVKNNLLKKDGLIFLEEPTYSKRVSDVDSLQLKNKKKYGSAYLFQYILLKN